MCKKAWGGTACIKQMQTSDKREDGECPSNCGARKVNPVATRTISLPKQRTSINSRRQAEPYFVASSC